MKRNNPINTLHKTSMQVAQSIEYACYGYLVYIASTIFFDQYHLNKILLIALAFALINFFSLQAGHHCANLIKKTSGKITLLITTTILIFFVLILIKISHLNNLSLIGSILITMKFYQGILLDHKIISPLKTKKHTKNKNITFLSSMVLIGSLSGLSFIEFEPLQTLITWLWTTLAIATLIIANTSILLIKTSKITRKKTTQRYINNIQQILKHHKKELFYLCVACAFTIIQISICNIYSHLFMLRYTEIPYHDVFITTLFGNLCLIILLPIMCLLSDKIDHTNLILIGIVGTIITPPLLFMLDSMDFYVLRFAGHFFYALFICSTCAPLFKIIGELLPAALRHIALSLSFSISIPIFGITTTHIADMIVQATHQFYMPGLYASVSSVILLLTILNLKKHYIENTNNEKIITT